MIPATIPRLAVAWPRHERSGDLLVRWPGLLLPSLAALAYAGPLIQTSETKAPVCQDDEDDRAI